LHPTRQRLLWIFTLIILIVSAIPSFSIVIGKESSFYTESFTITLYRDGLAHISHIIRVNDIVPEVSLPLLSESVNNILVLDENETLLEYEIDGSNITIFTLGAEKVTLEYETWLLTSMKAGVWTLSFQNPYNATVKLPEYAEVVFISDAPLSIDTEGNRIMLHLSPGVWEISYILPFAPSANFKVSHLKISPEEAEPGEDVTISVLVTNIGDEKGFYDVILKVNGSVEDVKSITLDAGKSINIKFRVSKKETGTYIVEVDGLKKEFRIKERQFVVTLNHMILISVIVASVVVAAFASTWRRRKPSIKKILKKNPHLRKEERNVLVFLAENNGRAFESEIRQRFPEIPRTTLWRLIRRLEKEEIVKIRRIGRENLVELR